MTGEEIIYSILNTYRGGKISDDEPLSDRFILGLCNAARAILIRQQYDRGQTLSDNIIQPIDCLSVTQVDSSTNLNLPSECYIVRSSLRLPKPVETKYKDLIVSISSPEIGGIPFELVPYSRLPFALSGRFNKLTCKIALKDGYLYIINAPFMKSITVDGVWANPLELINYTNCSGNTCWSLKSPYPLSEHLCNTVIDMVLLKLRGPGIPNDQINDASGNVQPTTENK